MQLLPRYLLKNRTNVVVNDVGFVTEYRSVYNRQLKVYKGIDNVLEFRALNADQKPVDVSSYTPKFQAFDENNNMVLQYDGSIVAGDDSAATRGLFTVTVRESDLLSIPQQYLSYSVHLEDGDGDATLMYSDAAFGNAGTIFISGEAYPGPKATKTVSNFTQTGLESSPVMDPYWTSSVIDAEPGINGNDALHTIVAYTTDYVGELVVQGTLENQVSDDTAWTDIQTITLTASDTVTHANFNGVYSYIRFKVSADPADKINKVLVRN